MKKDQCLAKLKQRTAKPGEVYAFYVEMLGKYGACQTWELIFSAPIRKHT